MDYIDESFKKVKKGKGGFPEGSPAEEAKETPKEEEAEEQEELKTHHNMIAFHTGMLHDDKNAKPAHHAALAFHHREVARIHEKSAGKQGY